MQSLERFTLAPSPHEIIVNRAASEGADDLFSYGPETQAHARSLGHLFVVGHSDQEQGTVGYLASLIAALAKREYFQRPEHQAKEAFTRTLRKLNEVVDEFFKSSGVGIDIGLFVVAGGTLYVSRLGRFRILLAREGKVLDVLNSASLFEKELVEKKRFSSIISGPIQAKDRLAAYFPQRALAARERSIRQHLLEESPQALSERLAAVGSRTPAFSCALLVVDIAQVPSEPLPSETAAPAPRLAWAPRQHSEQPVAAATAMPEALTAGTVPEPDTQEVPRIIPSEFSRSSRTNAASRAFSAVRLIRLDGRGKAIALGLAAIAVVGIVLSFKSVLYTSEQDQEAKAALQETEGVLTTAKERFAGGEAAAARGTLLDGLRRLDDILRGGPDGDATKLRAAFIGVLDEIDKAQPGRVSLAATLAEEEGTAAFAIGASGSASFRVLAVGPESGRVGIVELRGDTVAGRSELDDVPDFLVPAGAGILWGSSENRTLTLKDAPSAPYTMPTPERPLSAGWYESNAYVLTTASILKVSDLDTLKPVTKQWLADVSELAEGAVLIVVDGDVWTLSRDGALTKYYRGKKVSSASLPLAVTDGQRLLTTQDMPSLIITDPALRRAYVVDKESLTIITTITVETEQRIVDMLVTSDGALYFLAADGKLWRVE